MSMYVVIFDRDPEESYQDFHAAFVVHPQIHNWWHYIKSAYLIRTSLEASELADHFGRCARRSGISTTHLVMRVNPTDRQGRLVKEAWAWIRDNSNR